MKLRYPCLVLDHDDTAVDSTSMIHHPAHVEVMKQLRPHQIPVDLENWFLKNFDPGIMHFLKVELQFDDQEIEQEINVWRDYTSRITPQFYPGFIDTLRTYRQRGGIVTVVSHSESDVISRHYESATNGNLFLPDAVFGWTTEETKRKPHPYPVNRIMQQFGLSRDQMLVVDDLKPGVAMAKAAGVPVAGVGWSHQIEGIRDYMMEQCDHYFLSVDDFASCILE